MRRTTFLFALCACLALGAPNAFAGDSDAMDPAVRTFDFTYEAVVRVPDDAGEVRVWIPYPTDDEAQDVEVTKLDAPYPVRIDTEPEFGNSIAYLEVDDPQASEIPITLEARVKRTEKLRKDPPADAGKGETPEEVEKWLEPDRLVPLDERIREISREVTEGKETDLAKARAIYDYVVETMTYDKSGEGWGRGDIYWACDARTGNCTDFHALFTGLNRAAGIPAKFAIGFPIPPDRGHGEIGGYHCWAEFYLADYGWVPVDTSEANKHPEKKEYFFGAHDENRVEFSEGRDVVFEPEQNGDPANYFVYPYVEVDGEPWEEVETTFTYRDVS